MNHTCVLLCGYVEFISPTLRGVTPWRWKLSRCKCLQWYCSRQTKAWDWGCLFMGNLCQLFHFHFIYHEDDLDDSQVTHCELSQQQSGRLMCSYNISYNCVWSDNISWNRWHVLVKKVFTSLCKWQSGMVFEGWVRGKVWRPKEKKKGDCTALTCKWCTVPEIREKQPTAVFLTNTDGSHEQKRTLDCQKASYTPTGVNIVQIHLNNFKRMGICQNGSQILYSVSQREGMQKGQPAQPPTFILFFT